MAKLKEVNWGLIFALVSVAVFWIALPELTDFNNF